MRLHHRQPTPVRHAARDVPLGAEQPPAPGRLHPREVVPVIDDAHGVRLLVARPERLREVDLLWTVESPAAGLPRLWARRPRRTPAARGRASRWPLRPWRAQCTPRWPGERRLRHERRRRRRSATSSSPRLASRSSPARLPGLAPGRRHLRASRTSPGRDRRRTCTAYLRRGRGRFARTRTRETPSRSRRGRTPPPSSER